MAWEWKNRSRRRELSNEVSQGYWCEEKNEAKNVDSIQESYIGCYRCAFDPRQLTVGFRNVDSGMQRNLSHWEQGNPKVHGGEHNDRNFRGSEEWASGYTVWLKMREEGQLEVPTRAVQLRPCSTNSCLVSYEMAMNSRL